MRACGRLLLALILVASLIGAGSAVAAFWSKAVSSGNTYAAGTIYLTDNDLGAGMLSLTGAIPGQSDTSCIKVTYSGTLEAAVRLYASVAGSLAPYLTLTVTRGTSSAAYDSCTGFVADSTDYIGSGQGVVYSGTLSAFPASYSAGISDPTATAPERWSTGEVHAYKFVVTLQDAAAAQGLAGSATVTWEARSFSFSASVLSTPGLVSYWRLNETAGTTAADLYGSNPGTYVNGPVLGGPGLLTTDSDLAPTFDGSNDYVNVVDNGSLDFSGTSPMSIEAWVRPSVVDATCRRIASKEISNAGGTQGYLFYFCNTTFALQRRLNGASNSVTSGSVPPVAGSTYHLVATYDGSYMRFYVNGALAGGPTASSLSLVDHANPFRIGAISSSTFGAVGGVIDEVAVYNVALTAAQVQEHYTAR